ncbi:GNAT family N-acetyltransferase [Streptomyces sp. NPDC005271]|uniref:GNAT family N-acetyltransferase n=1 Tax=unclassified Streptomyces TaxID=2593676 RepID=UPI0033AF4708
MCAPIPATEAAVTRATTEALLDWLSGQGVTRVDLHATDDAERLYRSLGFTEHSLALSLVLSRRDA